MHKWKSIHLFDVTDQNMDRKWWLRIHVSRSAPLKTVLGKRANNNSGWKTLDGREVWPEQFAPKEENTVYDSYQNNPPDEGY